MSLVCCLVDFTYFSVSVFEKTKFYYAVQINNLIFKIDLKLNRGEERETLNGSVVKRKCLMSKNTPFFVQFRLVFSSVAIVKKSRNKITVFLVFENIRVGVSLKATFTHM